VTANRSGRIGAQAGFHDRTENKQERFFSHMPARPLDPLPLKAHDAAAAQPGTAASAQVWSVAGLGAIFFAVSLACLWFARAAGPLSVLWCANAVAVVWLATRARADWPLALAAVAIGGVLAGGVAGEPAWLTLSSMPVNLIEIVLGGVVLKRLATPEQAVGRPAALVTGLLLAVLLPAAVGALLAAWFYGAPGVSGFGALCREWFAAHAIGSLLVLPAGLLMASFKRVRHDHDRLDHLALDLQRLYETPPSLMHSVEVTLHAIADGVVIYADDKMRGYGNVVVIQHDEKMTSLYAHNSELKVKLGDQVTKGTLVALLGNTGHSTGPHVHFEISDGDVAVNPRNVLPKSKLGVLEEPTGAVIARTLP